LTIFAFFAVAVTKEDLRRQRYEELKEIIDWGWRDKIKKMKTETS
jgi:hypothetical protein